MHVVPVFTVAGIPWSGSSHTANLEHTCIGVNFSKEQNKHPRLKRKISSFNFVSFLERDSHARCPWVYGGGDSLVCVLPYRKSGTNMHIHHFLKRSKEKTKLKMKRNSFGNLFPASPPGINR